MVHTKESRFVLQPSTLYAISVSSRPSVVHPPNSPVHRNVPVSCLTPPFLLLLGRHSRSCTSPLLTVPPLKPQTRLLTHLRSLLIFVPVEPVGLTSNNNAPNALKTLDAIYSLTKYPEGSRELTEEEFAAGIEAARLLRDVFERELEVLERRSIRSSQSGQSGQSGQSEVEPSDLSGGLEGRELRGFYKDLRLPASFLLLRNQVMILYNCLGAYLFAQEYLRQTTTETST